MSAHQSPSFSTPTLPNLQRLECKITAQGSDSQPEEKQVGARKKLEPGIFMKKQELSEFSGLFDGGGRNPTLENKAVASLQCRLSKSRRVERKMKV
ncbi:MAG: hypothetical protein ACLQVM_24905 [Terriglobia bacterium]